jgi:hypothetical protein
MPETPDFEEIAQLIHFGATGETLVLMDEDIAPIVEQLRLVWNARGAADLTALEPIIGKLGDTMDPDNARVFVGDALRTVDR